MKTTQEKIEVMQAAVRGETIEFRPLRGTILNTWVDAKENPNWDWYNLDYRVKPIVNMKIAAGHNTLNFTEDVVGVDMGWRLLDRDEIKPRSQCIPSIEYYKLGMGWTSGHLREDSYLYTYRTKLTREQLAKYDLPPRIVKKRVPLGPVDFPPGTILRRDSWNPTTWTAVLFVGAKKIRHCTNEKGQADRLYAELVDMYSRSLDGGKTWLPCYKEIEVMEE